MYVSARYPPFAGGTEIHTAEVATRMAARGHDVSVLTTDATGVVPAVEERDGVRLLSVPAWPRDSDYYVAPAISRVVRHEAWDLLHVQGYHTAVAPIAMWAAARVGRPFVVTFHSGGHSSTVRRAIRPLQRWALRPLLRRARRLIGVSRFETDLFRSSLHLPEDRFVTIPNGTSFDPSMLADHVRLDGTRLVSVGRLERYKGHGRVIAALPELRERLGNVHYVIIGRGPYRDALLRQARQLGVDDIVEIRSVDPTCRDELARLVADASVFLLLSDYESQGMAVLEALALDVPVLVASTTALTELSDQVNVWAVPARCTPHELAESVLDVLAAPKLARTAALPRWDDIVDRLEAVYEDVNEVVKA